MALKFFSVRFYILLFMCSDLVTALFDMPLLVSCHADNVDLLLIADGNFPSVKEQTEQMNFFTKIPDLFLLPGESEPTGLKVAFVSMKSSGPFEHISFLDFNKTDELKEAIINASMVNFTALASPSSSTPRPTKTSPLEAFSESQGGRTDAIHVVFMVISKYTLEAETEQINGSNGYGTFMSQVCENVYNAKIFLAVITDKSFYPSYYHSFKCLEYYDEHGWIYLYEETFDDLAAALTRRLCGEMARFHDESLSTGSWYYVSYIGIMNPITWYEAASRCAAAGGELISIETQEELDFLRPRLEVLVNADDILWNWSDDQNYPYAAMIIGLRKNTENVATTFQWGNGNPLLISHWFPNYPNSNLGQNCGVWEFRGTAKQFGTTVVNGFVNKACGMAWTQAPLCEIPLIEHRQSDDIRILPAKEATFADALNRGGFTVLDDAIVSMPANVKNLLFSSDAGFPMFNCEPANEPSSFIPYSYVCDHKPDCMNRRDETICLYRECDPDEFTCESGQCVPVSSRCDIFKDCYDGSDERDCRECSGYLCLDGTCLPLSYVHDGVIDCGSYGMKTPHVDEDTPTWMIGCSFICNRNECGYEVFLNDGVINCNGPEGAIDEMLGKLEKVKFCLHHNISRWSPLCVYFKDRYGTVVGCRDMSHLSNCQNFICPEGYVKCPGSYCIPLHYVLDGNKDCPHGEDEKEFNVEPTGCKGNFACFGGKVCLHPDQVCNGSPQCPSGDDELDCNVTCADGFRCTGETVTVADDFDMSRSLRSLSFISPLTRYLDLSGVDLSYNFTFENRGHFYQLLELRLSGCKLRDASGGFTADLHRLKTVYLADVSYNRITEITKHSMFSLMENLHHLDLSHNKLLKVLPLNGFQTFQEISNLQDLDLSDTAITHINQTFLQGLTRLNKLNLSLTNIEQITENTFPENFALTTIDLRHVPLVEIHPDSLKAVTIYTNLYTDNYKLCCPQIRGPGIPEHTCHAPQGTVSSCFDLVKDETQRVLLWLVGILALLGNVVVIVYRVMFDRRVLKKSYGLFITNLSMADLLMGIYLVVIAGTDVHYRGSYVFHEKTWRNSTLCRAAGILSTLSSETSAFFIFLVTVDRFLVIKFPFGRHRFSKIGSIVSCVAAWCLGLVLALIPVLPAFSDWTIYSSNGMCLGLPLTTERPGGWSYSVAVFIVLNFIMFVSIACGQYLIYRAISENRMTGSAGEQTSVRRAQDIMVAKQLSLVALSDFLCWFPIGFMGLLALSGHEISKDAYTWSAVLALPINSALNPVLYTVPVLLDKWEKFKTGGSISTRNNSKTSSSRIWSSGR